MKSETVSDLDDISELKNWETQNWLVKGRMKLFDSLLFDLLVIFDDLFSTSFQN